MVGAFEFAVAEHGFPAVFVALGVVDVATVGADLTVPFGAVPVAEFDFASLGAPEHPGPLGDADPVGRFEHGPLHISGLHDVDDLIG